MMQVFLFGAVLCGIPIVYAVAGPAAALFYCASLIILVALSGFCLIRQNFKAVTRFLGSYQGTLPSGWHWVVPGTEVVIFDTRDDIIECVVTLVRTRDGVLLSIAVRIFAHFDAATITDGKIAAMITSFLPDMAVIKGIIRLRTEQHLRELVGNQIWKNVCLEGGPKALQDDLAERLVPLLGSLGIVVWPIGGVVLGQITSSQHVEHGMDTRTAVRQIMTEFGCDEVTATRILALLKAAEPGQGKTTVIPLPDLLDNGYRRPQAASDDAANQARMP
jgi:hypothetical protein